MKLTIILCSIISLIAGSYYYYELNKRDSFNEPREFGGVSWPVGTYYWLDKDEEINIEIHEKLNILSGEWPKGTQFQMASDELKKIIIHDDFKFAQLSFKGPTQIEQEKFPPNILHKMKVVTPLKIDGLDLVRGCEVSFKNHVLYSATCPEFDTVYFKRFVELPEVKHN